MFVGGEVAGFLASGGGLKGEGRVNLTRGDVGGSEGLVWVDEL